MGGGWFGNVNHKKRNKNAMARQNKHANAISTPQQSTSYFGTLEVVSAGVRETAGFDGVGAR